MTVRCKFVCSEKRETPGKQFGLRFTAVTSGSEENKSFWKWTPTGVVEFQTINEDAAAGFLAGGEYYFDISPA